MNESLTLADLRRWEDNGATWRPVEIDDEFVVLELCTCYGEPVEMARGGGPELIRYVRARRHDRIDGIAEASPQGPHT